MCKSVTFKNFCFFFLLIIQVKIEFWEHTPHMVTIIFLEMFENDWILNQFQFINGSAETPTCGTLNSLSSIKFSWFTCYLFFQFHRICLYDSVQRINHRKHPFWILKYQKFSSFCACIKWWPKIESENSSCLYQNSEKYL